MINKYLVYAMMPIYNITKYYYDDEETEILLYYNIDNFPWRPKNIDSACSRCMQKFMSRKLFRNYANKENDYLCTFPAFKRV